MRRKPARKVPLYSRSKRLHRCSYGVPDVFIRFDGVLHHYRRYGAEGFRGQEEEDCNDKYGTEDVSSGHLDRTDLTDDPAEQEVNEENGEHEH
jgi:hypothetical protein